MAGPLTYTNQCCVKEEKKKGEEGTSGPVRDLIPILAVFPSPQKAQKRKGKKKSPDQVPRSTLGHTLAAHIREKRQRHVPVVEGLSSQPDECKKEEKQSGSPVSPSPPRRKRKGKKGTRPLSLPFARFTAAVRELSQERGKKEKRGRGGSRFQCSSVDCAEEGKKKKKEGKGRTRHPPSKLSLTLLQLLPLSTA